MGSSNNRRGTIVVPSKIINFAKKDQLLSPLIIKDKIGIISEEEESNPESDS